MVHKYSYEALLVRHARAVRLGFLRRHDELHVKSSTNWAKRHWSAAPLKRDPIFETDPWASASHPRACACPSPLCDDPWADFRPSASSISASMPQVLVRTHCTAWLALVEAQNATIASLSSAITSSRGADVSERASVERAVKGCCCSFQRSHVSPGGKQGQ